MKRVAPDSFGKARVYPMLAYFLLLSLPAAAAPAPPATVPSPFFCELRGTVSGKLPSAYLSNTVLMGTGTLHCASKLAVKDFSVSLTVQDGSGGKNFAAVTEAAVMSHHVGPLASPEDFFGEYSLATGASGLIATRPISGLSFPLAPMAGPSLQQSLLEIQPR